MTRGKAIPPSGKERPPGEMNNLRPQYEKDTAGAWVEPAGQGQGNRKILIVSREARFSEVSGKLCGQSGRAAGI